MTFVLEHWRRGGEQKETSQVQWSLHSVFTVPLLLLKGETAQNKGSIELTVMGFVGTCCFLLMYLLFIRFQFALPSITSNKRPLQAAVSTSKSCRETWELSLRRWSSSRSADLETALSGRSMVDVLHAKHFPSCRVCSVWSELADSGSRPRRFLSEGSIN